MPWDIEFLQHGLKRFLTGDCGFEVIITRSVSEGFVGSPPERHRTIPHLRFGL